MNCTAMRLHTWMSAWRTIALKVTIPFNLLTRIGLPAWIQNHVCGESDMYKVLRSWNNSQTDFRAVGMMLCYALSQAEIHRGS